jgi:hypothetical protein
MELLPLDDPRWVHLNHRNWSDGKPSPGVPDAPFVPDQLARLLENPSDLKCWLCSEGTAWPAAFAAVPYAVELARCLPPNERTEYLFFVGLVVMCSWPETGERFLAKSYKQALTEALPLLTETLNCSHDVIATRYLLAAVAALKGHTKLANVLNNLECICEECPKCGNCVYPHELQAALEE